MAVRPAGWHLPGYQTKRQRIMELILEGRSHAEIRSTLAVERPGSETWKSEISDARARLVNGGKLAPLKTSKAVEVGGASFKSIRAAAAAHGLSVEGARKRLATGHPGWRYAEDQKSR